MQANGHIKATAVLLCAFFFACETPEKSKPRQKQDLHQDFLNTGNDARYVGMQTCRSCHENIYQTFIRTGMGRSFDLATREKSSATYSNAHIYDPYSDFHYQAAWQGDSLFFREYRLEDKDTTHLRVEQVNYIIGSGQHTNSHLRSVNGYVTQMPMTYYTQKGRWDLPPGFEHGVNTRFARKIGLECMSCHNAYPDFVKGSENKFRSLPRGIDCERCHGPGSLHAEARTTTEAVDITKEIDYTIVNPAKLPLERQFDICQRCHLQGNAVLRPGKSFFDFRPSQKLADFISVFMPRNRNGDDQFIMASHAERLKMSPCFIRSLPKADNASLRPYKDALTCVTCHNPHVSVRETSTGVFNQACRNCHGDQEQMKIVHRGIRKWDDCVSCHMPVSGATDIPHVSVHDHFIRKPVSPSQKKKIAEFLGLYAVNDPAPDVLTRARAYLDQYEKFEQNSSFLDSASALLATVKPGEAFRTRVHLLFVNGQYNALVDLVNRSGEAQLLNKVLVNQSYDNADAWTAYRIGETQAALLNHVASARWHRQAVKLAPYNLEFRNKLAAALMKTGEMEEAETELRFILAEDPSLVTVYSNLGYIRMLDGSFSEARRLLLIGKGLDPDNEPLLLNLATCHLQMQEKVEALAVLRHILKKNPAQQKAREALRRLGAL